MKTSKWKQNEKTFVLLAVLILLAVVVGAFKPDKFYTMANFQSMSRQLAEIGIYALATFVIVVSGGLNMSIVRLPTSLRYAAAASCREWCWETLFRILPCA